jgi:hypothetical protein
MYRDVREEKHNLTLGEPSRPAFIADVGTEQPDEVLYPRPMHTVHEVEPTD